MTSSHFSSPEERWRLEKHPLASGRMSQMACKKDEKHNRKIKVTVVFLQERKNIQCSLSFMISMLQPELRM